jgi:hypothetical protein
MRKRRKEKERANTTILFNPELLEKYVTIILSGGNKKTSFIKKKKYRLIFKKIFSVKMKNYTMSVVIETHLFPLEKHAYLY